MSSRERFLRLLLISAIFVGTLYLYTSTGTSRSIGSKSDSSIHAVRSSFDWATVEPRYHPLSAVVLPSGPPQTLRPIQYNFPQESASEAARRLPRQKAVETAFRKCWNSYRKYAWLKDELEPISATGKNTFGGWAATLIDSLDTLWIMGMREDFFEAVRAVAGLDWANTTDSSCNMFETNIRHLGGLLSAFDLSEEPALLTKAVELGDMLYTGFDTPNRLPPFWLDFNRAKAGSLVPEEHLISASIGSFALEFTRLSQLTGDSKYYEAIAHVTSVFVAHQDSTKLPGMWPIFVNARDETFDETDLSIGAMADSLYEYFPKMHLLLLGREPIYEKLYKTSTDTVVGNLLFRPMLPDNRDVLFAGSASVTEHGVTLSPEGQHLSCFAGGMFLLGGRLFSLPDHESIGTRLTQGCVYAYEAFPTGIMPEIFKMLPCDSLDGCEWDEGRWRREGRQDLPRGFSQIGGAYYLLRPEAIESLFILYRTTGERDLLDVAWKMFESIQAATETEYGNAAIENVNVAGQQRHRNSMESFWLAETLKYFYLIFSPPTLIDLDEYVLNTEAHPLKRPTSRPDVAGLLAHDPR